MSGAGIKEFFDAVEASREEYEKEYLPELARARAAREKSLQAAKEDSMNRLMKDLAVDRANNPGGALNDRWDPNAEDEEIGDDDDDDANLIDRSTSLHEPFLFSKSYLRFSGEDHWPGQYIDVTRAQRHPDENINWPRPG
jgi:GPN-loop GTPase